MDRIHTIATAFKNTLTKDDNILTLWEYSVVAQQHLEKFFLDHYVVDNSLVAGFKKLLGREQSKVAVPVLDPKEIKRKFGENNRTLKTAKTYAQIELALANYEAFLADDLGCNAADFEQLTFEIRQAFNEKMREDERKREEHAEPPGEHLSLR